MRSKPRISLHWTTMACKQTAENWATTPNTQSATILTSATHTSSNSLLQQSSNKAMPTRQRGCDVACSWKFTLNVSLCNSRFQVETTEKCVCFTMTSYRLTIISYNIAREPENMHTIVSQNWFNVKCARSTISVASSCVLD